MTVTARSLFSFSILHLTPSASICRAGASPPLSETESEAPPLSLGGVPLGVKCARLPPADSPWPRETWNHNAANSVSDARVREHFYLSPNSSTICGPRSSAPCRPQRPAPRLLQDSVLHPAQNDPRHNYIKDLYHGRKVGDLLHSVPLNPLLRNGSARLASRVPPGSSYREEDAPGSSLCSSFCDPPRLHRFAALAPSSQQLESTTKSTCEKSTVTQLFEPGCGGRGACGGCGADMM